MSHVIDLPRSKQVNSVLVDGRWSTVGQNGITEIVYHAPIGDGDTHFVDIVYDKEICRCFNVSKVSWIEESGTVLTPMYEI